MSTGTPFAVIQARLPSSALQLLDRMAELHLAAPPGSQLEFQWFRSQTWGAGSLDKLLWLGQRGSTVEFTSSDLQDLIDVGLVRRAMNSWPQYVSAAGGCDPLLQVAAGAGRSGSDPTDTGSCSLAAR